MKENFNVYHFFAGAFVPYWLLSRQEVSAGAKLTYAALAQQANSRGAVQLHFRVQATALGRDEGQLALDLTDLEDAGLIQVSRGNVNSEDVRVFFPPHPWMAGLEQARRGDAPQAVPSDAAAPPLLFPEAAAPAQVPLPAAELAADSEVRPHGRDRRGRRRRRQPQSKHPFDVCLRFVTYQKEVLRHDHIWNVMGLANHIRTTGEQDAEIDAWLAERSRGAA